MISTRCRSVLEVFGDAQVLLCNGASSCVSSLRVVLSSLDDYRSSRHFYGVKPNSFLGCRFSVRDASGLSVEAVVLKRSDARQHNHSGHAADGPSSLSLHNHIELYIYHLSTNDNWDQRILRERLLSASHHCASLRQHGLNDGEYFHQFHQAFEQCPLRYSHQCKGISSSLFVAESNGTVRRYCHPS